MARTMTMTSANIQPSLSKSCSGLNVDFSFFFQSLKLDLDFKDEKISSLNKELEDLQTGGASEEEVANLKRQKHELEMRLKEQARNSR